MCIVWQEPPTILVWVTEWGTLCRLIISLLSQSESSVLLLLVINMVLGFTGNRENNFVRNTDQNFLS